MSKENFNLQEIDLGKFATDKVATVSDSQTFWVGDKADIEVIVTMYEYQGEYKMTAWLNGTEEIDTINYTGPLDDKMRILGTMEALVHDKEAYIVDLANWDGE